MMDNNQSVFGLLAKELLIYPKIIICTTYIIALFSLLFFVSEDYQPFFLVNENLSMPNRNKWVADVSIIYTIILTTIIVLRIIFLFINNKTQELVQRFRSLKYLDNENTSLKDVVFESLFIFIICFCYFDTVFFGFQPSPSSLSIYHSIHSSVYFYCFFSLGLCYFFLILFFYNLFGFVVNFYEHEM